MAIRWLKRLLGGDTNDLDRILFHWSDGSPFRVEDALRHYAIWGKSGSGKTSGSGRHIARALLTIPPSSGGIKSGGMAFCSKPEEKDTWLRHAEATGRTDDLIVFNPESSWRCNVIDFLASDAREVTTLITSVEETLARMKSTGTDPFWSSEQRRCLYNAAEMLRLAYGKVSAVDIQQFILTAANHPDELVDPVWRKKYHYRTIVAADAMVKNAVEKHDYELCFAYWSQEFPSTAPKQRSGVIGMVMTVLHVFNSGQTRELIGTMTNFSPADMALGKWIIVDLNPKQETGRFILAALKYAAQRWVLNRKIQEGDNFTFLYSDEYQNLANSADAAFFAEARSHHGGMVILTQAYSSLLAAMGGEKGKHQVDELLSNVSTFVMHQLDAGSAEWASNALGTHRETFINISPGETPSPFDAMAGNVSYKPSYSETYQPVLHPSVFMDGRIRTGGKSNGGIVDGIVLSSRAFLDGNRYLKMAFKQ